MADQLSPGVQIKEFDLTTVIPAVSTTDAAFAGVFRWGPVGETVLIDNVNTLVNRFGKPTNFNAETFFTAYNFLAYSNRLHVSRAANTIGATPYHSVNAISGSANVILSNTSGLSAGMYVTQSSNSTVFVAANNLTISSVVNSTVITLSSNALATNGAVNLYFGNPATAYSAIALESGGLVANLVNQIVLNKADYDTMDGLFDADALYIAKYPGELGNSLRIGVCDTANAYNSNIASPVNFTFNIGNNIIASQFSSTSNAAALSVANNISIGDQILAGNAGIGYQYLQVTNVATNTNFSGNTLVTVTFEDPYRLHTNYTSNTIQRYWEFYNVIGVAPGQSDFVRLNGNTSANDELHIVVVDEEGKFTGTPGTVLETYSGLSRATDAKNNDNTVNYYKDVINKNSQYIWWANDRSTADSALATLVASSTSTKPLSVNLTLGSDGYDEANVALSALGSAYDLFVSPEVIDISLILQGKPSGSNGQTWQLANYLINIAARRMDCIVLISPERDAVLNNVGSETSDLIAWRNSVTSSSYAVIDSGYKYQYDRYNDIYRWTPLNGDIAGLCVQTDTSRDAWWSPAGFNRGQIKNIVKLAFNPNQANRDLLYSNNINPVVTFPGQGTILYGDKTAQAKASAFDRINVRRLFIVLEKAISRSAKNYLFEFNDAFTRAQFLNTVNPYLRTVKGRRGITDFYVVCDETNNTPQIIDSNQFVGDIYIKPARSINFIKLNFVAVATGVQFSEVIGRFE
jgi:phage tail sheath protein FI